MLSTRSGSRWLSVLLLGLFLSAVILLAGCAGQATPTAEPTVAAETPVAMEESPTVEETPAGMEEPPTGEAEPTAVDETPDTEEGSPVAGAYQPLDAATCSEIETAVAETLGVETTLMEASFQDIVGGGSGSGCEVQATGTGVDFGSHVDVANDLIAMFEEMGWAQDMQYAADSPTATAGALRSGEGLCLFMAGWEPGPAVQCPADQPISACDVPPDQQIYTITVNCARQ